MKFEDQSFVVIGAGSTGSIGLNFVKELLAIGVKKIAIFDTNTCETINELKFRYGANTISFYKVDIRRKAEIESAFQEVINKFGYVDVLANVAGIADETRVEDTVQNNFFGTIYSTFAAVNHMSLKNGGRGGMIVNVPSVAALYPFNRSPVYSGTNAGVLAFTRSLSDETLSRELGIKFVVMCRCHSHNTVVRNLKIFGTMDGEELNRLMLARFGTGQTADECAKSMLQAMKESENGSVWILAKGKHSAVDNGVLSRAFSR